ncbi:retrotransposon protein, putative, ty1-copia subclass, partial [Tanacetum coccineum]
QKANKKSLNAKCKNKVNGKGKDKKVYILKPNNPKSTAKERPAKDDACHHCKEVGHWKRNCHVYLAELQKKRKQVGSASSSGIFTIELFSCQFFGIERKLKQGALYFCFTDCGISVSISISVLPRGVVSVSRLVDNGFVQCFTDCGISVSKNGVLYFNVVPRNGIYEIDMHDLVPNVNSIYNVSNKRVKHNLDSTYLWHCRLAHINKKRITVLKLDDLALLWLDLLTRGIDGMKHACLSGQDDKETFSS